MVVTRILLPQKTTTRDTKFVRLTRKLQKLLLMELSNVFVNNAAGFICWLNLMMVSGAVEDALPATMSGGENLKLVFTQGELKVYNIMISWEYVGNYILYLPRFATYWPLYPEKYVTNEWGKRLKFEDGTDYSPLSAIPMNGRFHLRSLYPPSGLNKLFHSFHDNGANAVTGVLLGENHARHPHDVGGPNSGSLPLFRDTDTTFESEDINVFDAASTIHGLSGISDSGCAPSLPSLQSQNPSSHSSGIPFAHSLVIPGSHNHNDMSQVSGKVVGVSSQASTSGVSNKFSSSGMHSAQGSHLGALLISDACEAANFDITDVIYQGSEFMNTKDGLSCEDGPTIDLLQLSSQLQQVEHQRQSMQMKLENDAFSSLRIT